MKNLHTILAAAFCGAIFTLGVAVSAQPVQPGFATVDHVEGIASYSLGDGNWHPLVAGKILAAGAIIRTGENGVVDVILGKTLSVPASVPGALPTGNPTSADSAVRGMATYNPKIEQNVIRLSPNSTLAVDKLTVTDTGADTVNDTELDLQKGDIFFKVKKDTAASQYLIKIPNGVAAIRGTEGHMGADGRASCHSSTHGGFLISITTKNGATQTFEITPGNMLVNPASGQIEAIPPQLQAIFNQVFQILVFLAGKTTTATITSNNGTTIVISSY